MRHGQSTWNLERRLQGQRLEVPLTELGLAQAAEAAERVAALVHQPCVVSSDQLRARQTAEVIARRLGTSVVTTELAREQGLGELEGRLIDTLTAEPVPEGVDISEVAWGGGESIEQVHARCQRLLDELPSLASTDEVVLVSHGDLLRVLLAVLDRRGHREVEWRRIGNGEVIVREHLLRDVGRS